MDTLDDILRRAAAMADGERLSDAETAMLDDALGSHPFFTAAAVALLLHGDCDAERRHALEQMVALTASCRRTVAFASQGRAWADFYPAPEEAPAQRTEDVIDTFLSTYGSCTPEEERQLERLIFNPTADYAELLARQEQQELPDSADDPADDPGMARINAFIRSHHPASQQHQRPAAPPEEPRQEPTPEAPISKPEHVDDSLLSESLAKIFIKQGRYERAFEIISGLNLNFPKKSAYFADQLRFLQKLIINQRRRRELDSGGDSEK